MYLKPHKSAHEVPWTIGYIISSRLSQIKCATHNLQPSLYGNFQNRRN